MINKLTLYILDYIIKSNTNEEKQMKHTIFALITVAFLTACSSGVNFEFSTSQDKENCMEQNPSNTCSLAQK